MNIEDKKELVDSITKQAMDGDILKAMDGLKLKAVGFAMLAKVDDGRKYRIERSSTKVCKAVTFYPLRGHRAIVTHDAWSVLSSIQGRSNGNLNGLELL